MRIQSKKLQDKKVTISIILILLITYSLQLESFHTFINYEKQDDLRKSKGEILRTSAISGRIVVDNNWSAARADNICTGSGNFTDPYVIEDLIIDGGGTGTGISIRSRRDYFRIENCTIFNCAVGIDLYSTDNGTLIDNDCSFNDIGIYLHSPTMPNPESYGCFNNFVIGNIVNNNSWQGIYVDHFCEETYILNNTANYNDDFGINYEGYPEITISGNTANFNRIGINIFSLGNRSELSKNLAVNNEECGIYCHYASGWILTENVMEGSGLIFPFPPIEAITLMNIDTTNTVNNGPIYFYVNETNLTPNDFLNAGQIILGNCTDVLIKDVDVSYSSIGISIFYSNNVVIENCVSSNNIDGIFVQNSNNSIINRNLLNNNRRGIELNGINHTISKNDIYYNNYGLELTFCQNATISDNDLVGNYIGIFLRIFNTFNIISENIIKDSIIYGISVGGSDYNTFYGNFLKENTKHVDISNINNDWNNTDIGNYWDNYTGVDINGDGLGDTPHNISTTPLIQDYLPIVDEDVPEIIILSPSNNSVFGTIAPGFNVSVKDKYLEEMWYTLNDGPENYIFIENGSIDQNAWDILPDGQVIIKFHAIDKPGNLIFKEIIVYKKVPSLDLFLIIILSVAIPVIGIISVSTILLILRRRKLNK